LSQEGQAGGWPTRCNHHSGRRKGKREYTSGKYKSKGGFDKESLKKKYLQKENFKEHAFLTSLSDLDHVSNDTTSSSSDEETKRRVKDKLNRLASLLTPHEAFAPWPLVMMLWVAITRTLVTTLLLRYHTPPMISPIR
jgi:hypothetical protein